LKSPVVIEVAVETAGKSFFGPNVPSPTPRRMLTVALPEPGLTVARSGTPSPLKSPMTTERAAAVRTFAGAKVCASAVAAVRVSSASKETHSPPGRRDRLPRLL
jgi:hypothetical protein